MRKISLGVRRRAEKATGSILLTVVLSAALTRQGNERVNVFDWLVDRAASIRIVLIVLAPARAQLASARIERRRPLSIQGDIYH